MRQYGVLIISHGSRDHTWVELVRSACAEVDLPGACRSFPIACCFLELVEGHLIQDGIDELEQAGVTDIITVPLFLSSGSTHLDEIAWALGVQSEPQLPTDLERLRVSSRVHLCAPIDDDPEIAALVVEKLAALSRDPSRELVLLIGHGSEQPDFQARYRKGMRSLAAQVKRLGGFVEADIALLLPDEAAGRLQAWRHERPELTVLVVPLFLSQGYFTSRVIPERLTGLDYVYNGMALLPSRRVTEWISRKIVEQWSMIEMNG